MDWPKIELSKIKDPRLIQSAVESLLVGVDFLPEPRWRFQIAKGYLMLVPTSCGIRPEYPIAVLRGAELAKGLTADQWKMIAAKITSFLEPLKEKTLW